MVASTSGRPATGGRRFLGHQSVRHPSAVRAGPLLPIGRRSPQAAFWATTAGT